MKIGIITMYYDNANYGGLLQAYALQQVVTSLGLECEQISYDFYRDSYGDKIIKHHLRKIKRFLRSLYNPFYRKNSLYKKELKKFEKSIPHSNVRYSKNISKIESEYDAFICGSDQIWNPVWWNDVFFLSFSTKKKISYAASIATEKLTKNELDYFQYKVNNFWSISVREKQSLEFLKNHINLKCQLMPDPTLLLTKQEWESVIGDNNKPNCKPYVFAYLLGFDENQRSMCIDFAKKNNLDIIFVPYIFENSFNWDIKHTRYQMKDLSVSSFLDTIRNAKIIITDSFHGTVFSCIFERPFYVLERNLKRGENRMNSRIETLLYELEISNERIVATLEGLTIPEYNDIEAIRTRKKILEWREKGINYLYNNLI